MGHSEEPRPLSDPALGCLPRAGATGQVGAALEDLSPLSVPALGCLLRAGAVGQVVAT